MEKVFDIYDEFYSTDVRKDRTDVGYRLTKDLMQSRHELLLPPDAVRGKTVLDIGCCVAATGAWTLHHGAVHYRGVEIDDSFADQAERNLGKNFSSDQWEITRSSLESFLIEDDKIYDIIVAIGVVYAVIDTFDLIRKLSSRCSVLIIESQHPLSDWKHLLYPCFPPAIFPPAIRDRLLDKMDPIPLMEAVSSINIKPISMVKGQTGDYYREAYGSYPSMSALEILLSNEGFTTNTTPYEELKKRLPDLYGMRRFALVFNRSDQSRDYVTVSELLESE